MIKKLLYCLFFLQVLSIKLYAQVQWIHGIGADNSAGVEQHRVDSKGNIIAVGYYNQTIQLGGFTLTSKEESDIFVYKSDKDGNILWAHSFGGPVYGGDVGVAIDAQDNIYIAGGFIEELYYDDVLSLTALNDSWSSFIVKLNSEGEVKWIKEILGQTELASARVWGLIDVFENTLMVAGNFFGEVSIAGHVIAQPEPFSSGSNMFIAKLDLDGNMLWVKNPETETNMEASDIHIASDHSVYLTGFFTTTAHFDNFTLTAADNGHGDIYAVKLNSDGTTAWAKAFVKNEAVAINNNGRGITSDNNGNAYVVGNFGGTVLFDSHVLDGINTEESRSDIFFVKINNEGETVFAKRIGTESRDLGQEIHYYDDKVLICGSLNHVPFYYEYDFLGNLLTSYELETHGMPLQITADKEDGSIYLSGILTGPFEDVVTNGSFGFLLKVNTTVGIETDLLYDAIKIFPNPVIENNINIVIDDLYTGSLKWSSQILLARNFTSMIFKN